MNVRVATFLAIAIALSHRELAVAGSDTRQAEWYRCTFELTYDPGTPPAHSDNIFVIDPSKRFLELYNPNALTVAEYSPGPIPLVWSKSDSMVDGRSKTAHYGDGHAMFDRRRKTFRWTWASPGDGIVHTRGQGPCTRVTPRRVTVK